MHTNTNKQQTHAIFGGTFDPCHLGHLEILHCLKTKLLAKKISVLPAKNPIHKTPICNHQHRINMLKLMLNNTTYRIDNTEMSDNISGETIDTLKKLYHAYPNDNLIWIIGDDSFASFNTWQDWERILDYCNLIILQRTKPTLNSVLTTYIAEKSTTLTDIILHKSGYLHIANWSIPKLSSTNIRNSITNNENPKNALHPKVYGYIKEHRLY